MAKILDLLTNKNHQDKTPAKQPGSYYHEHHFSNKNDIKIEIDQLGPVPFPMTQKYLNKLKERAVQAKYGKKEKTLLDTTVRDTLEIEASQISLTLNDEVWHAMLENIKQSFNFGDGVILKAHLHNLLIYGPGQFFKQHQDSEKLPGMIATLVIVLPTAHIGGHLEILHGKMVHQFKSENIQTVLPKAIAFFADCKHSVLPVTDGHRIALTFNLVLESKTIPAYDTTPNSELVELMTAHFDNKVKPIDSAFLLLLEHQYSENGLSLGLLKGNDIHYANLLLPIASKLNLNFNLSLVEVFHCLDGFDEGSLIDEHVEITYLDTPEGGKSVSLYIDRENVESILPLNSLSADEEEFEGWMGNYGNTSSYWYYRAGIFLIPKQNQIVWDFKTNPNKIINDILDQISAKTPKEQLLGTVNLITDQLVHKTEPLAITLRTRLAVYVEKIDIAQKLIEKLSFFNFTSSSMSELNHLDALYGTDWVLERLTPNKNNVSISDLSTFYLKIKELRRPDSSLANELLNLQIGYIETILPHQMHDNYRDYFILNHDKSKKPVNSQITVEHLASKLIEPIAEIIATAIYLKNKSILAKVLNYLVDCDWYYDIATIMAILNHAHSLESELLSEQSVRSILNKLSERFTEELEKKASGINNKAIDAYFLCRCEYCTDVQIFLRDPEQTEYAIAIAEMHRNHILDETRQVTTLVNDSIDKSKRPYSLILKKSIIRLQSYKSKRFEKISKMHALLNNWITTINSK